LYGMYLQYLSIMYKKVYTNPRIVAYTEH